MLTIFDLVVVHEGPSFPDEGMAVGSAGGSAGSSADMGKEQCRAHVGRQRAQITVVLRGEYILEQACLCALRVPGNAKAVPISRVHTDSRAAGLWLTTEWT